LNFRVVVFQARGDQPEERSSRLAGWTYVTGCAFWLKILLGAPKLMALTLRVIALCFAAIGLLALSACAKESLYSQSGTPPVASNKGRVFLYCPECAYITVGQNIQIDGRPAGTVAKGVFFVDLSPGAHRVFCARCYAPANGRDYWGQYLDIDLGAGEAYYISFVTSPGGLHMTPVNTTQGGQDVTNLPYIHD